MVGAIAAGGKEHQNQQSQLDAATQAIAPAPVDRPIHEEQLCFYRIHHRIYHHQRGIIYIAGDTVSKHQLVCHLCPGLW